MFLGGSMIQAVEGWESWTVFLARRDLERVSTSLGWAPPSLRWDSGVQLLWSRSGTHGAAFAELGLLLLALPAQSFPNLALLCLPPWEPVLMNPLFMPRRCCWRLVPNAKLLPAGAFGFLGTAGSRFSPLFLSLCPNNCPNYCSCGLAATKHLGREF